MTFTYLAKGAIINLFMLLGFVTLFSIVRGWMAARLRLISPWIDGFLFGGMAAVAMMVPSIVRPGLIFDCRSGIIGTAALFGGPLCALISIPVPCLYRLQIGGIGLVPGLMEIVLPALLGSMFHWIGGLCRESLTLREAVSYSLIVGAFTNILIVGFVLTVMPNLDLQLGIYSRMIELINGPVSMVLFTTLLVLGKKHTESEAALSQSEEKYRQLVETTDTGYVILDRHGCVVDANPEYLRLTGRQRLEETIGHSVLEWTAPYDLERNASEVKACEKQGGVRNLEIDYVTPGGGIIPIEINATVFCDAYDLHILTLCRDITERKQMAEILQKSEARYKMIVDHLRDAFLIHDFSGRVTYLNENACRLTGYNATELMADGLQLFQGPEGIRLMPERMLRLINDGRLDFEGKILHKDGSYVEVDINASILSREGKGIIQSFMRDITERKRAEENIQKYQEQLRNLTLQLSLTEEKERRHIAMVLHDSIGQNLALSKIKMEELQSQAASDDMVTFIDEIVGLIKKIISQTRSLTFELSPPVLYELGFEAAIRWLGETYQKQYSIRFEFQNDRLPKPLSENTKVLLFQSARELMVNVVKHANAKSLKASLQRENDNLSLIIEDDGIGFDFSSPAGGTGKKATAFGIFSIRERMKIIGGDFEIASVPGQGTKAILNAPLDLGDQHANTSSPGR